MDVRVIALTSVASSRSGSETGSSSAGVAIRTVETPLTLRPAPAVQDRTSDLRCLVVDDSHCADAASLRFLAFLLTRLFSDRAWRRPTGVRTVATLLFSGRS